MKDLIVCWLIVFSCCGLWIPAAAADNQDHELVQVAHLKNYLKTFRHQKQPIWPGFNPESTPSYVFFSQGHFYALNFSPFSMDWKSVESPAGYIYTTDQDKWGISKQSVTQSLSIDGQNGFAYQFDQLPDEQTLHVFVHERFHRYQREHFKSIGQQGWYLDSYNLTNLALIRIENECLNHYLKTQQKRYLNDYFVISLARRQLISDSSWKRELSLQRLEGTASYIEYMAKNYYEKGNLSALASDIAHAQHRRRLMSGFNTILDQAARWRHYFVGATLCFALDTLQVSHWRERVEQQGLSPWDILQKHLAVSDPSQQQVNDIKSQYHYPKQYAKVSAKLQAYQVKLSKWQQLLNLKSGIFLELSKPNQEVQSSSRNERSYYLADQSVLEIDTVGHIVDKANSWKLNFKHVPLLINNKFAWIMQLKGQTLFNIDGRHYTAKQLLTKQSLKFTHLTITNPVMNLMTRHPGMIFIDDRHIKVKAGTWHS